MIRFLLGPRFATANAAWLVLSVALSTAAIAAPSPPPRREPPPKEASTPPIGDQVTEASGKNSGRAEAESLYAAGYREVEKAHREQEAGKAKDAKKRFGKARGRFEEAVKLDPEYFEAWNMLGYTARQAGDLKASFAAYDRCLTIKPDYDKAHAYRGEAYLMKGDVASAKQELAWLRAEGSDEADKLAQAIEKAEGKKPAGASDAGATKSTSGW